MDKPIAYNYVKAEDTINQLQSEVEQLRKLLAKCKQERSGRWIDRYLELGEGTSEVDRHECSECGYRVDWIHRSDFCPKCGSRMEGTT